MQPPADVTTYGDVAYWDGRFEGEAEFEWCGRYRDFAPVAAGALARAARVLVLGNGTSALPVHLAADPALPALREVVVTDASRVAVAKGRARAAADAAAATDAAAAAGRATPPAALTWEVADAAALPFGDAAFDAVVEKGVLDALAARHARADPWAPPAALVADVGGAAAEAARVTRRGGALVSVSFAQPHFRTPLLRAVAAAPRAAGAGADGDAAVWSDVAVHPFGEGGAVQYFVYVCARGGGRPVAPRAGGDGVVVNPATGLVAWKPGVPPSHDHMDGEDYLLGCGLSDGEE